MAQLFNLEQVSDYMTISLDTLKKILAHQEITTYELDGKEYISEAAMKDVEDLATLNLLDEYAEDQLGTDPGKYDQRNKLNDLTGKQWIPETKSFWFQKGLGKNHPEAQIEKQHPAPFSFQDIERLIRFFTKSGDIVMDPFLGVGSTLKAAAVSGRNGVGIELSPKWYELSKERLDTEVGPGTSDKFEIINGDSAQVLKAFEDESVDFVVTSPPYWSILNKQDQKVKSQRVENGLETKYSEDERDLGNIESYDEFLDILVKDIFLESARVLKTGKYFAIVISDFRNKKKYMSFHSDLIQRLDGAKIGESELSLQGVKVLIQNHKSLHPYGYPFAYVENIHHQYILIFRKVV